MTTQDARRAGLAALDRAAVLERELTERLPGLDVWSTLDDLRDDTADRSWCLLPTGGYGGVVRREMPVKGEASTAQLLAAFHHWRYSRSVYVIEPGLWDRITGEPTMLGGLEDLQFPEWCVYLTLGGDTAVGAWAHLIWDDTAERPMLNLLLDGPGSRDGLASIQAVTIPLGHASLTEALEKEMFDGYAERMAEGDLDLTEDEVRKLITELADALDGIVAVVAYLARPEADIIDLDDPTARPVRALGPLPAAHPRVWLAGYSL